MARASTYVEKYRNRSILVVGNKTDEMRSVSLLLKRFDYDVRVAFSAGEAIAKVSEAIPALIITEMILPGVGFDVVPSDCLNLHVRQRLPSATHLKLFIRGVLESTGALAAMRRRTPDGAAP